jgi:hypothetical protein
LYDRKQSGPFETSVFWTRDYGAAARVQDANCGRWLIETTVRFAESTADVDNFVGNCHPRRASARQLDACARLLKS